MTTAKKTAAKRPAAKRPTPAPPPDAEAVKARQEDVEARVQREFQERVDEATEALEALEESVVQREWLLITLRLDRTREQIAADGSLRLLALAWVREKRDHGGADWDRLLEMTDKELVDLHGFPTETPEETLDRLQAAVQDPAGE
jgi:hypothetical protein